MGAVRDSLAVQSVAAALELLGLTHPPVGSISPLCVMSLHPQQLLEWSQPVAVAVAVAAVAAAEERFRLFAVV